MFGILDGLIITKQITVNTTIKGFKKNKFMFQ